MTAQQLVSHYYDLKSKNEMTKTEIKAVLAAEHGFNPTEIKAIILEISNRELFEIQNQKSPIEKFLARVYVSYFFLIFGLIVIVVSIFILQAEIKTPLNKILPLILICGAIFMLYKHGKLISQHRKRE
jgi:hypothetical protein